MQYPPKNILKTLSGTSWGHQKETLKVTYTEPIKPVLTYADPICHPPTCQTSIPALQMIHNKALRVITSSLKMFDQQHLHAKTMTPRSKSTATFSTSTIWSAPSARAILLTNTSPLTLALAQAVSAYHAIETPVRRTEPSSQQPHSFKRLW